MPLKAVSLWVKLVRDSQTVLPLVRRGPLNEDGQPQSFVGLLQPPVHGKTDGREARAALFAEIEEEAGAAFLAMVRGQETALRELLFDEESGVQPYVITLTEDQWATYVRAKEFVAEDIVVTAADLPKFRASTKADKAGTTEPYVMFVDQLRVLEALSKT